METYQAIAISLGLGLIVGLQREWKESDIAGIRTFPLITLLGTVLGQVSAGDINLLIAAGLISVAVLLVSVNIVKAKASEFDFGLTTEIAALVMYGVGVTLAMKMTGPAVVVTGIVAVLLHLKQRLHNIVDRMAEKDIRSVIHLVLIALVILPVLPDQTYGPYDVLNPYKIWRMVVLIVGISMSAYVIYKLVGARAGAVLGGILGGLISSTATTVSYARQTKENADAGAMAALVIVIASTIVNLRVLIEVGVVAPRLLNVALLPIALLMVLMTIECLVLFFPLRNRVTKPPDHDNPAQLKPAIIFGALYAVVLFIVAAAKEHFGDQALYVVAIISGLTDVDAITLSTARLFQQDRLEAGTAWRVILIATLSNLVFKAGAVAVLGSRKLLFYVAILFGIAIAGGVGLLLFWPDVEVSALQDLIGSGSKTQ
ncbi:MAG: MgtC/SapB family protein [Pirellulaceae bacterium]|nr:MgtC/SapB family protein [Pirellulaceae bacterium]